MQIYFVDDSAQGSPSHPEMGRLIALGGIALDANQVGHAEDCIDMICKDHGFPDNEEFKWSPPKGSWMRTELVGPARDSFYRDLFDAMKDFNATIIAVIEDTKHDSAGRGSNHELDITDLLLERIEQHLKDIDDVGLIIADQHGGGNAQNVSYLQSSAETIRSGTDWVKFNHIAMSVVTGNSHLVRLLQVADVVASCTCQRIGGENTFSPAVFDYIKPLFRRSNGRIGGVGLKIHPGNYANLYHWLLGDTYLGVTHKKRSLPIISPGWPFGEL